MHQHSTAKHKHMRRSRGYDLFSEVPMRHVGNCDIAALINVKCLPGYCSDRVRVHTQPRSHWKAEVIVGGHNICIEYATLWCTAEEVTRW